MLTKEDFKKYIIDNLDEDADLQGKLDALCDGSVLAAWGKDLNIQEPDPDMGPTEEDKLFQEAIEELYDDILKEKENQDKKSEISHEV